MRGGLLQAARRWQLGHSPMGGTPPKDMSSAPMVPNAPPVASRTKPGTVPMRTRGFRPEMMR